jgi:hypothetical protein
MEPESIQVARFTGEVVSLISYGPSPHRIVTKPMFRRVFDIPDDMRPSDAGQAMCDRLKHEVRIYDGPTEAGRRSHSLTDIRISLLLLLGWERSELSLDRRRLLAIIRLQAGCTVPYWRRNGPERELASLLAQNIWDRASASIQVA